VVVSGPELEALGHQLSMAIEYAFTARVALLHVPLRVDERVGEDLHMRSALAAQSAATKATQNGRYALQRSHGMRSIHMRQIRRSASPEPNECRYVPLSTLVSAGTRSRLGAASDVLAFSW
jgi:hypothetical protein